MHQPISKKIGIHNVGWYTYKILHFQANLRWSKFWRGHSYGEILVHAVLKEKGVHLVPYNRLKQFKHIHTDTMLYQLV